MFLTFTAAKCHIWSDETLCLDPVIPVIAAFYSKATLAENKQGSSVRRDQSSPFPQRCLSLLKTVRKMSHDILSRWRVWGKFKALNCENTRRRPVLSTTHRPSHFTDEADAGFDSGNKVKNCTAKVSQSQWREIWGVTLIFFPSWYRLYLKLITLHGYYVCTLEISATCAVKTLWSCIQVFRTQLGSFRLSPTSAIVIYDILNNINNQIAGKACGYLIKRRGHYRFISMM